MRIPDLKRRITAILDVSADEIGLGRLEEAHLEKLLEALNHLRVENMQSSRDQISAIQTLLNSEDSVEQGIELLNALDEPEIWEAVCGHFEVSDSGHFVSSKGPAGMGDLLAWIASPFSKEEPRTPLNISEDRKSKNITDWPAGWEAILKNVDRRALTNFPKLDYPYNLHRIPNVHLNSESLPDGGQLRSFRHGPYGSIRDINIFSRSAALEELIAGEVTGKPLNGENFERCPKLRTLEGLFIDFKNIHKLTQIQHWKVFGAIVDAHRDLRGLNLEKGEFLVSIAGCDLRGNNLKKTVFVPKKPIIAESDRHKFGNHQRANPNVSFYGANLRGADFSGSNFSVSPCLMEADFSSCNLSKAKIIDKELQRANLEGANLTQAVLTGSYLNHANLRDANLQKANLCGAVLIGANLKGANLTGAMYDLDTRWPAGFDYTTSGAFGPHAHLRETNLSKANLRRLNLQGVDLSQLKFKTAKMNETNLQGSNLSGAQLKKINMSKAYLKEADLSGADLSGANLQKANLIGANLRGAILTDAKLEGAAYSPETIWPDGVDPSRLKAHCVGPKQNLRGADLQDTDLRGESLKGANLSNANLNGTNLGRVNLMGANLTGAKINDKTFLGHAFYSEDTQWPSGFGPMYLRKDDQYPVGIGDRLIKPMDKNFNGVDLRGVPNLTPSSSWMSSNLQGANLSDFSDRLHNLKGSFYSEDTLWPEGANLNDTLTLIGPNANLQKKVLKKAILRDANLQGADLSHSELQGVDLGNANLEGANLEAALYSYATRWPQGFDPHMAGAYLYGPYSNLQGVVWSKRDADSRISLQGVNLQGATWTDSVVSGVNFTRANLQGATLENLSGFRQCIFAQTDLSNATLRRMDLRDANLSTANLSGANLQGALYNASTQWPADFSVADAGMHEITPGVNLSGADLSEKYLVKADLRNADLSGANLNGTNLRDANLNGARLTRTNLSGANLSGTKLHGVNHDQHTKWPEGFDKSRLG